ncbi:hypothetical protein GOBAR_AA27586 [Gossypium barbadense]|uniref:Uncharacterized protein n=1 Tax=Gossypium barbadense TaxID=3634 RepID=A0A2P5WPR8_GOSBA|nr:hypothetical protein GOBAR_AA27586 [Gossypium barbadense]
MASLNCLGHARVIARAWVISPKGSSIGSMSALGESWVLAVSKRDPTKEKSKNEWDRVLIRPCPGSYKLEQRPFGAATWTYHLSSSQAIQRGYFNLSQPSVGRDIDWTY